MRSIVISVSVCLSARISQRQHVQISPNFLHDTHGRGSVLLWQCDTLCTSGFVDDVMFPYNQCQNYKKMLTKARIRERSERKKIRLPRGAEKLKVNCLVMTVKIMFKWYTNVVTTTVGFIRGHQKFNCNTFWGSMTLMRGPALPGYQ